MNEPRQHDAGASLTDCLREFRRAARLAAADPLRLLPLDPLTRLASLSAPITALFDLAPFERLRDAVAAPPVAPHRDAPRMGLQPFAGTCYDARTKAAAIVGAAAPEVATKNGAPTVARRAASSSPASHEPSAQQPVRRESVSTTTLAERRAALRRGSMDAGSPSPSTSRFVGQAEATTGSRSTPSNEARELGVPARRQRIEEGLTDPARQLTPVPFESVPFDGNNVTSSPDEWFAPAALDRATHHALFIDDEQQALSHPVPFEIPAGSDVPAAAVRHGRYDRGLSAVPHAPSSHVAGISRLGARTPQADASTATRRRAWEPTYESELADALFETLYRDGVDLTWP